MSNISAIAAGYQNIQLEMDGKGVATCTFNRPEQRNALSLAMVNELHDMLGQLKNDPQVRALIFRGAGEKAFVSGADINELRGRTPFDALQKINGGLFREVETFPHPTLAAIRGYALGGGMEFALACDLRVAGEGAKFGQPEVSLGIIPGAGGCTRLPRLVGLGRAKELILTGKIIHAPEALAIGLVNRVVPDAEVYHATRELAEAVIQNAPLALRFAKEALNAVAQAEASYAMALESSAQAILFVDEEKNRRMDQFLERKKRP